jgi:hypothetical protein
MLLAVPALSVPFSRLFSSKAKTALTGENNACDKSRTRVSPIRPCSVPPAVPILKQLQC